MVFGKLVPAAVVVAIAVWSVWPVVVKPGRVADYGYDGWFINWIINQQVKIVSDCIRTPGECKIGLFQGNIYYPYRNTLAYSDLHFLDGIVAYIPVTLSNNPAVASGWVMAAGQVATMLILYMIYKNISGSEWSGVMGSVVFGLSQVRWEYQVHLHTWSMQYWLVGCWLMVDSFKKNSIWKLVLGSVLLGLQMWQSVLPVYFGLTIVGCWLLVNKRIDFKKLFLVLIVVGVVVWPVIRVYSEVAREMGFVRSIRDAANGGMSVDDIWGKFYSPGLYLLLAVAVARLLNFQYSNFKFLTIVTIVGVVMALGPALKWQGKTVKVAGYPIPLPYAAAYYAVPGLQASRTVSRWMWLAGFGMSGIIAIGLSRVMTIGVAGALLVAVVGGAHLVKYRDLPSPKDFPSIYKWLRDQPGEVIEELPKGGEDVELQRMYYSWIHDKRMVNGYSGFKPPEVDVKVDYVIIHKKDEEVVVVDTR